MKDLHSSMNVVAAVGPVAADADAESSAIDLQGYNGAEIVVSVGIGGITFTGSNKIEFVVTHSDASGSGFEPVAAGDILGGAVASGGIVKALTAAHAAAAAYRFGYKGGKRHIKVKADFSGTHATPTPLAISVIRGAGDSNPQADQA